MGEKKKRARRTASRKVEKAVDPLPKFFIRYEEFSNGDTSYSICNRADEMRRENMPSGILGAIDKEVRSALKKDGITEEEMQSLPKPPMCSVHKKADKTEIFEISRGLYRAMRDDNQTQAMMLKIAEGCNGKC